MNYISGIVTILITLSVCDAYKILVVYPFPARSHNILGNGVVRHLLNAGHEITYITAYPMDKVHPNLHQIDVSSNLNAFPANAIDIRSLMHNEVNLNDEKFHNLAIIGVVKNTLLVDKNIQKFLSDTSQTFDVVVAEWMFNEIYAGFGPLYNCPFIWAFPYEPHAVVMDLMDEATNPAYVPNLHTNNVTPFNFMQRVEELWNQIKTMYLKAFFFNSVEKEVYEKAFSHFMAKRGRTLPDYYETRYNTSLMFGNSHASCGLAIRLPQSYKVIGGYYIDDVVKPLPDDLQKVMDNAKHGVILFSLGSNLKSKDLPQEIKKNLLKMFSELKQTVIWKFEEDFPGLPKNIVVQKWAPQQSILAHPNCVLFITHGGLLSTTETVHFSKPFIGIPVFGDQFSNVNRAVDRGFARRVDISYTLADDLKVAINDILSDSKYAEKIKEVSQIYHDRVVPPGAELVHWVEHVVRTRGAPHLRSPALHVPFYQKMYLDLALVLTAALYVIKIVLQKLLSFFVKGKKANTRKKNN